MYVHVSTAPIQVKAKQSEPVRSFSLSLSPLPVSSSSAQTYVLSGCKQLEKSKYNSNRVPLGLTNYVP